MSMVPTMKAEREPLYEPYVTRDPESDHPPSRVRVNEREIAKRFAEKGMIDNGFYRRIEAYAKDQCQITSSQVQAETLYGN
jgi:hypothetical protein